MMAHTQYYTADEGSSSIITLYQTQMSVNTFRESFSNTNSTKCFDSGQFLSRDSTPLDRATDLVYLYPCRSDMCVCEN